MSFGKHINKIIGETYNLLRNIKIAFSYIDEDMIKTDNNDDMSKIGVRSISVVAKFEKGYKKVRKNPERCN